MNSTPIEHLSNPANNILQLRLQRAIKQFGKYCIVGASGFVINLAIFTFLVRLQMHYMPAATVSFCVSATNNFVLNKYWTFNNPQGAALTQAGRFLVISVTSWALNVLILHLLIANANINSESVAQAIAITAVTLINFAGNKMWSFRQTTS